jgi:ribonuclease Z
MAEIKIQFLGTSSAVPTKDRGLSCTLVRFDNELIFFDCGEGAQRAAITGSIGFNKPTSIYITHMHGDHVVGLLGLLQTMAMNRRETPLSVYGPKGIVEFVTVNQRLLNFGLTYTAYGKVVRRGVVFDSKKSNYRVLAERSHHSTMSYAYLIEEKERPGRFNPKKAISLGVPEGPLWGRLQSGHMVTLPGSRRKVRPKDVLGPARKGARIGISGDTRPTPALAKFFRGCDVIIFDSTYGDQHEANAIQNLHSTAREAATLAKRAKAKHLLLTHFSARYQDVSELLKEAREVFPQSDAAYDGMVFKVPRS